MDEGVEGKTQQYCQHCGARLRTDTAFCTACGKSLVSNTSGQASSSRPSSEQSNASSSTQNTAEGQDITPYIIVAAIVLITVYLFVSYSVFAGIIFAIVAVVGVGWFRQSRGNQTEFEKQIFEKLPEYKQSVKKASGQASSQYREWNRTRTNRLQQEADIRAKEREFSERRVELEQYRTFFQRACAGSDYFLSWWGAYANGESKEMSDIPVNLNTLRRRAETGLRKTQEAETVLNQYSGTEEFAEQANLYLNDLKVGQENFHSSETIFTPMVAVHNGIKDVDGWVRFQGEFERFVKDLEDLLGSPAIKTEAANRARFPNPAENRQTREVRCSRCGRENVPEANYCLGCGAAISASGQGTLHTSPSSGTTFVLLSIPFAIVALFLFPPVFGGIGIFLGYRAMKEGNEGGGIAMMVVNGACLLFGMLSGMLFWGF